MACWTWCACTPADPSPRPGTCRALPWKDITSKLPRHHQRQRRRHRRLRQQPAQRHAAAARRAASLAGAGLQRQPHRGAVHQPGPRLHASSPAACCRCSSTGARPSSTTPTSTSAPAACTRPRSTSRSIRTDASTHGIKPKNPSATNGELHVGYDPATPDLDLHAVLGQQVHLHLHRGAKFHDDQQPGADRHPGRRRTAGAGAALEPADRA